MVDNLSLESLDSQFCSDWLKDQIKLKLERIALLESALDEATTALKDTEFRLEQTLCGSLEEERPEHYLEADHKLLAFMVALDVCVSNSLLPKVQEALAKIKEARNGEKK